MNQENMPETASAAPINELRVNAMFAALQQQRDAALHHGVMVSADLASANAEITRLQKALAKLNEVSKLDTS